MGYTSNLRTRTHRELNAGVQNYNALDESEWKQTD